MRPGYPPALFRDLAHLTGLGAGSDVLEVGCGTGQATRPLAELTGTVTAVEPGDGMAELARRHLADLGNVNIECSTFDAWDDRGRRFDAVVAASSWHWVDLTVGWSFEPTTRCGRADGWRCWATSSFAGRASPRCTPRRLTCTSGSRRATRTGVTRHSSTTFEPPTRAGDRPTKIAMACSGPTVVRWYPTVQWLDGEGFADLLRTLSIYRKLAPDIREPLLDAVADRIRSRLGDHAPRRYLTVLRVGQRLD